MRATVVLALAFLAGTAEAYPQFQLATGATRCNQCHYAPAGGGLINGYGRGEAGDTISMGGDGAFLHGAWSPPPWLALGADLRVAGLANDVGATEGAELAAFPMQADLYLRVQAGPISVYGTGGVDGAARAGEPGLMSRLVSREHFIMWRPRNVGPYVRAGRFFAPYGLRLAEHPIFVRRFLGFDMLEETYNVSGGWVDDVWELHATAFTPDFWKPVEQQGSGGALYVERRFGTRAALGAQARASVASVETRVQGGLVGKLYLSGPRVLLLGQADLVRSSYAGMEASSRLQWAAYLGGSWTVVRGLVAQIMLERWDENAELAGVARSAVDLQLQWFPTAHVELSLFGRLQVIGAGRADGDRSQALLLQAHYYL